SSGKVRRANDYKFFTEFQSHETEFDYLKSLEIEEKINAIKWCPRANGALFLLSTNDKTVKLWKIREKRMKKVAYPERISRRGGQTLELPQVSVAGTVIASSPRRVFANAHAYHVNSIDPNSDGEHFISTDDLRINLWNLEITDRSYSDIHWSTLHTTSLPDIHRPWDGLRSLATDILDIKPQSMEELTEVITAAVFQASHCHVFLYSSSRGCIKMGDMRASALCDRHAKVGISSRDRPVLPVSYYLIHDTILERPAELSTKSFFSEIVASISDIKSTPDGRYIISRDYMTLKLWDVNMEARPVKTINVHEHLRPQLCDLYENDCIFDKFECAVSGDTNSVLTGSYNNMCHIYDRYGQNKGSLEYQHWLNSVNAPLFRQVCKDASKKCGGKKGKGRLTRDSAAAAAGSGAIDYGKKILHMSWHPQDDIVAVAGNDKLYIYSAIR
ncbi:unnamed protein product, partial [Sphacelaria rigidula]